MKIVRKFSMNYFLMIRKRIAGFLLTGLLFSGCGGEEVSVLKGETVEDSFAAEQVNMDDKEEIEQEVSMIYVDLGGAVQHPGVYTLPEGSRVFALIALAGGFTEDADTRTMNQADILEDGEKIYVYTMQETEDMLALGVCTETQEADRADGKVNLNRAGKEDLMTLSGIGETRALAILQYREEHGCFQSIEELMQVDGIKEKTYEKIKDSITV